MSTRKIKKTFIENEDRLEISNSESKNIEIGENPKNIRRVITDKFIDSEGKKQIRSMGGDFETLDSRHIDVLKNIPGLEQDSEIDNLLGIARDKYEQGLYNVSLEYLNKSLERIPKLEPYIFYYIKVCKHVLSIPLTNEEKQYEIKFNRYLSHLHSLPKWLSWIEPKIPILIRCKWCGRYTQYVSPNDNSFGFIAGGTNSCRYCGMSFPMPSWMWDSPDGRAYSYYRQSFPLDNGGKQFYEEFLKDYNPHPTVEESGLFSKK